MGETRFTMICINLKKYLGANSEMMRRESAEQRISPNMNFCSY